MRELEAELKTLKVQLRAREQELEAMKPRRPEPTSPVGTGMAVFRQALPYHTYAVGHVLLFVSLVLSTATSLRGANQVMALMMSMFALPVATPSWATGRLWLLRLGYYKLTRPKAQADDWVWIADHTVQLGPEKCEGAAGQFGHRCAPLQPLRAMAAYAPSLSHSAIKILWGLTIDSRATLP